MSNSTPQNEKHYVEESFLAHLEHTGWTVQRGGNGGRSDFTDVILESEVKGALTRLNPWLTDSQIDDVCNRLRQFDGCISLFDRNREGDIRLASGLTAFDEESGEDNKPIKLIDFQVLENKFDEKNIEENKRSNSFLAISQFRLLRLEKKIIPDIVLFVNGLPLVVVECKSPERGEPFVDGATQLGRYLQDFPSLFDYNQFVVSTCRHTAKYATVTGIGESNGYFEWKDSYPFSDSEIGYGSAVTSQERLVWGMLSPVNFLDIIRNYIIWDGAVKKVPRYMQYRGARKVVEKLSKGISEGKGGTLWHTQGSGKSLTMMYVIRQMYHSNNFNDWKIVLIVDRDDLEKQLRNTADVTGYHVRVAQNIVDCKNLIADDASNIIIAMLHKFGTKKEEVFEELNSSDKILVMIDEAHRSEYGELAAAMAKAMPNAIKVAFSGTPITKTTDTFGGIVDTYTMRQAVEDGVVVEIRYEGRATDSTIIDEKAMNGRFIDVFGYAEDEEKQKIIRNYTLKGYMEAELVIRAKAADMLEHYIYTVFPNGFKAQVAAYSREAAYRYKLVFEELLKIKIAALKKDNPQRVNIARLSELKVECIISSSQEDANNKPYLKQMCDITDKEKILGESGSYKMPFNKGGNTGIIIVKDMLLTGFDAPIEQVLYIDRKLINHNLLQAVARVNRICGADKKCGYIVDYVGITRHLKEALAEYADMNADDSPANSLINISKDVNRLNEAYTRILTFIRDKTGFDFRKQTASVIEELVANEELRDEFNNLFRELSKYYDRVLPNPRALEYRNDINVLAFIRGTVANRTRDPRYSMNDASAKVRAIIEEYLSVNGVGLEVQPIDILSPAFISGVQKPDKSDRAAVDEIIYAVREYITKNTPKDPELFERLSERLNGILEKFKGNWKLLRTNLVPFVTIDLPNARKNENSYGYDMEKEMPFFALLRREIFGNQTFDELKQDDFNALRTLTNECLSILKRETRKVDFWWREAQILEMRTNIREMLMDMERTVPSIEEKKDDIVQKIVELGKEHYK